MQSYMLPRVPSDGMPHGRIRPLAQVLALKYALERNLPPRPLSIGAEELIASHDWKSDFSALAATIRHAVIMAEGNLIDVDVIRLPHALAESDGMDESMSVYETTRRLVGHTTADVERELILLTIECCGNRTYAADVLGISLRTLRNKLRRYSQDGIPVPSSTHQGRRDV